MFSIRIGKSRRRRRRRAHYFISRSQIAKTVKVNSSGSEERKIRMQGYGEDVSRFTFVVIGQRKERNFPFLLVDKILGEIRIRFSFY